MADINVNQEEIRTTREVVRELGSIMSQLEEGHVKKIVIMSGRTIKGVVVSMDEYARLTDPNRREDLAETAHEAPKE